MLLTVISMYRRSGEGATGAKVGDRLPEADLEGGVVAVDVEKLAAGAVEAVEG